MEPFTEEVARLGGSISRMTRNLVSIGESRLELLFLEFHEEREHFVRSLLLALGIFAFGLLGMASLTAAVAIGLRTHSTVSILGLFAGLYGTLTFALSFLLWRSMRRAEPFSATFDQLRKDHRSVEKIFL